VSWWQQAWGAIQGEFSDLSDIEQTVRVCVRLLFAMLLGAVLGYDREKKDAAAGLRTHMLVALGAALFVIAPQLAGIQGEALNSVIQGLIAGIGFLGAGAIIKLSEKEEVKGLTTAASIWATAAIAMCAGLGRETTAVIATLFALTILALLPRVERAIPRERD
jgi:putative Mg2+ transporter-C (MgtC) family protein